jgi:glycosyltransferase involved in cell wall biosynthesis
MDLLVAFARPSYARISMSPTKLAEAWACGIPALCNSGVGDVAQLVSELHAGMVIDVDSDLQLQAAAKALADLVAKAGIRLREAARSRLSLELAAGRYLGIYRLLRS